MFFNNFINLYRLTFKKKKKKKKKISTPILYIFLNVVWILEQQNSSLSQFITLKWNVAFTAFKYLNVLCPKVWVGIKWTAPLKGRVTARCQRILVHLSGDQNICLATRFYKNFQTLLTAHAVVIYLRSRTTGDEFKTYNKIREKQTHTKYLLYYKF
jgi:hypothetical protein